VSAFEQQKVIKTGGLSRVQIKDKTVEILNHWPEAAVIALVRVWLSGSTVMGLGKRTVLLAVAALLLADVALGSFFKQVRYFAFWSRGWLAVITFCDAPSRKLEVCVLCRTMIQEKSYKYLSLLSAPRVLFRAVLCPACALRLQSDPSPQCHLCIHFHLVFTGWAEHHRQSESCSSWRSWCRSSQVSVGNFALPLSHACI